MSDRSTAPTASRTGAGRRTLSVRNRLFGLVALLCALWLISVGVAAYGLAQAKSSTADLGVAFHANDTASNAYTAWLNDDDASNMYVAIAALKDPTQNKLQADTWAGAVAAHDDSVASLTELAASQIPGVSAKANDALAGLKAYDAFSQQVHTKIEAGDSVGGARIMTVDNADASNKLAAQFDAMSKVLDGYVSDTEAATSASATRWTVVLVVLVALGLVIAFAFVIRVIRSITTPLDDIQEALRKVSAGDLKARAEIHGEDELGRVARALNEATAAQQASVAAIGSNAQLLAAAAEELTATSNIMSGAAMQTSTQAGEVATSAENVNHSVQTASAAADELTASIAQISASAWEAARVASTAVDVAQSTSHIMSKLGNSSEAISKVIKEIKAVADQTNLLALNATIESARAGEAGKGFAVVASEVKELARATANATTDITQKITTISEDTQDAILAIEEISGTINQINDIQQSIATAVEEQTAAINEIARSMSDAASGSGTISATIDGVTDAAQGASSGAAQTQQAANELAVMASSLEELVGAFRY
jgi:methyl-accepting chemotaxis protein